MNFTVSVVSTMNGEVKYHAWNRAKCDLYILGAYNNSEITYIETFTDINEDYHLAIL